MSAVQAFSAPTRNQFYHLLLVLAVVLSLASPGAKALGGSGNGSLFGNSEFLPVDEALPFDYTTDNGGAVVLAWNITPPGHYLYKSRIQINAVTDGVQVGEPGFSLPGTLTEDEFFGEITVFFDPVQARVPITLPDGVREAELQVTYQGCAEAGLCYPPPQTRDIFYYPGGDAAETAANSVTSDTGNAAPADTSTATGLAGFLSSQSIWMIAGVFFLLGLGGLTFTPCVLPMVPIISSMVSGRNTRTTSHALLLSGSYVLGMALTYAAAGVITGLLGASFNLQAQLQSPWVLSVFAGLFVVFALSMFDLFEIQLPRFIREPPLNDASHRLTGSRVASIFGIGALSALIVSPCVSAPLAGSLLYISTTQDAVIGGVALLALGLGMGVPPLILVAVGGRKLLPSSGHWMTTVKHFYGVMLLAVAIWLVERLVPVWFSLTMWGGLLIAITGVQLAHSMPPRLAGSAPVRGGWGGWLCLPMAWPCWPVPSAAPTTRSSRWRPLSPPRRRDQWRASYHMPASSVLRIRTRSAHCWPMPVTRGGSPSCWTSMRTGVFPAKSWNAMCSAIPPRSSSTVTLHPTADRHDGQHARPAGPAG